MTEDGQERGDTAGGAPPAHFTLMDRVYRHQRHIYNLTRKYFLLGRDRLVRELGAKPGEAVVEIGCGTARNLIRIAHAYPGVTLYGLDASREMLRTAEDSLKRAGLADRVVLVHALAEEMTPAMFGRSEPFDHAVFSYSLSMIPDWRAALRVAAENVRPAGTVQVVDFGDLAGLPAAFASLLRAWLRLFHVAPREALVRALERGDGEAGFSLRHIAGRYAFLLTAKPGAILESRRLAMAAPSS